MAMTVLSVLQLSSFIEDERKKYTIYPVAENVFSWTTACKLRDVKVVILGQDPYHGPKQAHGKVFLPNSCTYLITHNCNIVTIAIPVLIEILGFCKISRECFFKIATIFNNYNTVR